MTDLVWEEPPAPPARYPLVRLALTELAANPGRWAKMKVCRSPGAARGVRRTLVNGLARAGKAAEYECVARGPAVYARKKPDGET